jgi:RsiW-degrading membrane proteinase PrsW (M82 family)
MALMGPARRRVTALPQWERILAGGSVLWIGAIFVTATTGNFILIPTVVLLGSFLVPVTAVVWYMDHYHSETLTPRRVVDAFVVGGILGVLGASLLEAWLRSDGPLFYLGVGLIEEFCKLAALILVAWHLPHYTTRDGVVLGAAVGFGFGALESSGYALNALVVHHGPLAGPALTDLVMTELLHGVLAPVGHGLWTAILGGVLFRASRGMTHPHLTGTVVGAYLLVSLLHALWDSMRGLALLLTDTLMATAAQHLALNGGLLLPPTLGQVNVFVALQWGGVAVVSLAGCLWLRAIWRSKAPQ